MTGVAEGEEWVLPDAEAVAQRVAEWLTEQALAKNGPFVIALSGGSTPKRLYEILASSKFADRFPWSRTELFFGDERFVPPDDEASNYRMVNQALLSQVDKLRRANSKLRRKYRDLRIAADEQAERMEVLELELEALKAAGSAIPAQPRAAASRMRAARAGTEDAGDASKSARRPRSG